MACKKTSSSVASKASKLLKDGRTSKTCICQVKNGPVYN